MAIGRIERGLRDFGEEIKAFPAKLSSKWKDMSDKEVTKMAFIAGAVTIAASVIFALLLGPAGVLIGVAAGVVTGIALTNAHKRSVVEKVTHTVSQINDEKVNKIGERTADALTDNFQRLGNNFDDAFENLRKKFN